MKTCMHVNLTRCKNLNIFPFPTESQIPKSQNLQKVLQDQEEGYQQPRTSLGVGRSSKSQVPQSENEVYKSKFLNEVIVNILSMQFKACSDEILFETLPLNCLKPTKTEMYLPLFYHPFMPPTWRRKFSVVPRLPGTLAGRQGLAQFGPVSTSSDSRISFTSWVPIQLTLSPIHNSQQ